MALFPSFDSIDVFGPLNPLSYLAFSRQLNLALIANTLEPVFVEPAMPALNPQNSCFLARDSSMSIRRSISFAHHTPK